MTDLLRESTFLGSVGLEESVEGPDFERFVAEGAEGLLRTAYLIVGDLQEAEDLWCKRLCSRWLGAGRGSAAWTTRPRTHAGSLSIWRCVAAGSGRAAGPS